MTREILIGVQSATVDDWRMLGGHNPMRDTGLGGTGTDPAFS